MCEWTFGLGARSSHWEDVLLYMDMIAYTSTVVRRQYGWYQGGALSYDLDPVVWLQSRA